jgi:hypothetical protein
MSSVDVMFKERATQLSYFVIWACRIQAATMETTILEVEELLFLSLPTSRKGHSGRIRTRIPSISFHLLMFWSRLIVVVDAQAVHRNDTAKLCTAFEENVR